MVLSDLPYKITDCDWDKGIDLAGFWAEVKRVIKPQSSVALFASGKFTFELVNSNYEWYKYKWVWVKNKATCFVHAKNKPMSKYEEILIFSKGVINHKSLSPETRMKYNPQGVTDIEPKARKWKEDNGVQLRNHRKAEGLTRFNAKNKFGGTYGERPSHVDVYTSTKTGYPSDVVYFEVVNNVGRLKATQKPVELLEYLIRTYTDEGDLVLDATVGSGSTAIAARNTGRRFIGYEIDKGMYEKAVLRIERERAIK